MLDICGGGYIPDTLTDANTNAAIGRVHDHTCTREGVRMCSLT
jgi:hypothetical protein